MQTYIETSLKQNKKNLNNLYNRTHVLTKLSHSGRKVFYPRGQFRQYQGCVAAEEKWTLCVLMFAWHYGRRYLNDVTRNLWRWQNFPILNWLCSLITRLKSKSQRNEGDSLQQISAKSGWMFRVWFVWEGLIWSGIWRWPRIKDIGCLIGHLPFQSSARLTQVIFPPEFNLASVGWSSASTFIFNSFYFRFIPLPLHV